jgi:hypothetical protein
MFNQFSGIAVTGVSDVIAVSGVRNAETDANGVSAVRDITVGIVGIESTAAATDAIPMASGILWLRSERVRLSAAPLQASHARLEGLATSSGVQIATVRTGHMTTPTCRALEYEHNATRLTIEVRAP